MTTWILVIILSGNGRTMATATFHNRAACESAIKVIEREMGASNVTGFCFQDRP